jgi:hypothetical protein
MPDCQATFEIDPSRLNTERYRSRSMRGTSGTEGGKRLILFFHT